MQILSNKYRQNLAKMCLVIGTFFNPLGFDAAFSFVMKLTGSYWITDGIFYGLALSFFGFYYILSRRK